MKADLYTKHDLWNKSADEMIRLFQRVQDAGIWTQQEATRHVAGLESLRAKLNSDFRELMALCERTNASRLNVQDEPSPVQERS
jgi:hypothetical protein